MPSSGLKLPAFGLAVHEIGIQDPGWNARVQNLMVIALNDAAVYRLQGLA